MGKVLNFPTMYSLEDVYNEIPQELRPAKQKLFELIERHGLYRELCGKKFMVDSDIEALFDLVRAIPTEADVRGGPARLIAGKPSPNTLGYMVVLGDKLDIECPVFIGWAPRDSTGVTDLIALVQYGYPGRIDALEFCAATPAEVDDVRAKLSFASFEQSGWFTRCDEVTDYLVKLRNLGASQDDAEEESESVITKIGELQAK